MQIVRTPGSARAIARTLPRPVGLVPTMGALHAGHLALVRRARSENASVVASIFVNPLQFGPSEDFDRYPRAFEADAEKLEAAGVDLLYAPEASRMYPPGFATTISVSDVSRVFEGARRPGHFDGVATVVAKLFHAIEPTSAYFGQKDVQQTAVIRAFVRDLDFATNIVVAPTVREADGLALSSRNAYLTPQQRAAAPSLYRAICAVVDAVYAGERDPARACAIGAALIEAPLELEYLAIVDPKTFAPLTDVVGPAIVVAVAVAGATRLLDNAPLPGPGGVDPIVTPARPRARTFSLSRSKR
jgi:pantoate--beta-alanine ligase